MSEITTKEQARHRETDVLNEIYEICKQLDKLNKQRDALRDERIRLQCEWDL